MDAAPQHGPRPLPLFLDILRSETAASPDQARLILHGLRAYQDAERPARRPPKPAIATAGRATLRDHGGTGLTVVFVPSLINPPGILDLAAGNSLLEWLATQGVRPLLVDWGTPTAEERELSVSGHVETLLLPLLASLAEPPVVVGYCLGGTMALAAAALRPVIGLGLIATPWHFAGFPDQARADLAALWAGAEPFARVFGLLPMEVLQTAFWKLDPARTVTKFARFANLEAGSEAARAFIELEDWANDGPPLTFAAGREIMEDFIASDLPGTRAWRVSGVAIDPASLDCPVLNVISTVDRIVPAATAAEVGERVALAQGHVGMIVGGQARVGLWKPLASWLSGLAGA